MIWHYVKVPPQRYASARLRGNGHARSNPPRATDASDRLAKLEEQMAWLLQHVEDQQHTLEVQFKRIAAIQAQLDQRSPFRRS
jgi:hypothetical protein